MSVAEAIDARPVRQGCPDWFPDWRGEIAVLVGAGPSAKDAPIDLARGRARVIAINNSWQLAPWADALYACDWNWWNHANGCPEFRGLKMTIDRRTCQDRPDWGVHKVECNKGDDRLELRTWNRIGWGGNSGFGALNIAVQAGATRIILVGYDMTTRFGRHWHQDHPNGMHNPTEGNVDRWRRAIDNAAAQLRPLGIEVFNASPISALRNYPKVTLAEALAA